MLGFTQNSKTPGAGLAEVRLDVKSIEKNEEEAV